MKLREYRCFTCGKVFAVPSEIDFAAQLCCGAAMHPGQVRDVADSHAGGMEIDVVMTRDDSWRKDYPTWVESWEVWVRDYAHRDRGEKLGRVGRTSAGNWMYALVPGFPESRSRGIAATRRLVIEEMFSVYTSTPRATPN